MGYLPYPGPPEPPPRVTFTTIFWAVLAALWAFMISVALVWIALVYLFVDSTLDSISDVLLPRL